MARDMGATVASNSSVVFAIVRVGDSATAARLDQHFVRHNLPHLIALRLPHSASWLIPSVDMERTAAMTMISSPFCALL